MKELNTPKSESFNKKRIYRYVKRFSFPRLAGTEGEKRAVELTINTFKDIGFEDKEIEKEPFEFSDFYSTTLIKLIMMMNLIFTLTLVLLIYIYPIVTIVVIAGMAFLLFMILRGLKHPEYPGFWGKYYGEMLKATNVFVKIPAKLRDTNKAGNIVISAHLDSKSQTLRTSWRIVLYRVMLFSGILLFGFYTAIHLYNLGIVQLEALIVHIGIWGLTIIISFSNIILMFLNTHNKSPGALDNASGMSIVFELASYFNNRPPLDNFNLWFCQFSAEELGTMGSRIFVNNHESLFIKGRVFQINLEIVSSAKHKKKKNKVEYLKSYGIFPRKKISPLLGKYLKIAAEKENLRFRGFHVTTGAHSDTVPFHLRKYDAVDIATRAAAKYAHNKVDTPDKVDPQILLEACMIIRTAILLLEKDYEIICENKEMLCEEE